MRGMVAALGLVVVLQGMFLMWQQVQLVQLRSSVRKMDQHVQIFYSKTGRLDDRFQMIESNQDRLYRNQQALIELEQEQQQAMQHQQTIDWANLLLPLILGGI